MTTPAPQQSAGDIHTWQVVAHLSALVVLLGIPSVVGPLVVWLMKKDQPDVEPHARAALDFHLSVLIYAIGAGVLGVVLTITIIGAIIGIPLILALIVLLVAELVISIIAAVKVDEGVYSYPLRLHLIR